MAGEGPNDASLGTDELVGWSVGRSLARSPVTITDHCQRVGDPRSRLVCSRNFRPARGMIAATEPRARSLLSSLFLCSLSSPFLPSLSICSRSVMPSDVSRLSDRTANESLKTFEIYCRETTAGDFLRTGKIEPSN